MSKTPKPSNWKADTVQSFEHDMLGKAETGNKLGIRNCFTSMYEDLVKPWLNSFEPATPFGAFVITGTPGIGKSVFLAYVASRLAEEGINIVIQLGKRWWSRISGQTITHNDTWPVKLLDDSKTVLLADPVGGENSQPVDPRMCGCTIIFTSPQQKNYDSVWKQAEGRSERYSMPVWSEEEVLNHWKAGGILQVCKQEADVKMAYAMIGGSVRYLGKLLVAVAKKKTTLEEEAKQMIRDCVVKCTFEDLCQAADSGGADIDAQNNRSKMSRVLHIHSDAKFQTPNVKLIESKVVLNILCDQLAEKQRKALPDLIRASLNISPLGTLCGRLFQMHVAEVCKSKKVELVCTALKTNKDKTESAAVKICIPTLQKMLKKLGDQPPPKPLPEFDENCLYCPESETFPAADFFFVTNEGKNITLWLLQVTKAKSHDCKTDASYKQFNNYFQLNGVKSIKWVVVAPEGDIADGVFRRNARSTLSSM